MVFSSILFLFRFFPAAMLIYFLAAQKIEKSGYLSFEPFLLFLGGAQVLSRHDCLHPLRLFCKPGN